jgi:hypothetical protein
MILHPPDHGDRPIPAAKIERALPPAHLPDLGNEMTPHPQRQPCYAQDHARPKPHPAHGASQPSNPFADCRQTRFRHRILSGARHSNCKLNGSSNRRPALRTPSLARPQVVPAGPAVALRDAPPATPPPQPDRGPQAEQHGGRPMWETYSVNLRPADLRTIDIERGQISPQRPSGTAITTRG